VAEDEDLRIDALRQQLMREIDAVRNDAEGIGSNIEHRFDKIDSQIKNLRFWVMGLVTVFGVIAATLAAAANII